MKMDARKATDLNPSWVHVPYELSFHDGPGDFRSRFKQVLEKLSRTDTLFWCARLSLILADPNSDAEKQPTASPRLFLYRAQIEKVNKFVMTQAVLIMREFCIAETFWSLFAGFVSLCRSFRDDIIRSESSKARETFAQALLMSNEL